MAITSKIKTERSITWRSGKGPGGDYIKLDQHPSGEWGLVTVSGSTHVTPQILREIADEMDAVAREIPEA